MNVHEYQAKEIFRSAGVHVSKCEAAGSVEEAVEAAKRISSPKYVVKAQVHAGGRGKGGGVKLAESIEDVREAAEQILGMNLVTPQTGPEGKHVHTILIAEAEEIHRELYLGMTLDRAAGRIALIASAEGGVEIETVAAERPDAIFEEIVDPVVGLMPFQANRVAFKLGLDEKQAREFADIACKLANAFQETDASLIEINPLAVIADGHLCALDAKMSFDDNALYRQPKIAEMRDETEEDPRELEAKQHGLSYVSLDGDIGCMVNGAGLAMATMDIIQSCGGKPANFLDVGGRVNAERVAAAFNLILSDANVRAILVNIFGGIVHCDLIAEGILNAAAETNLRLPLVVRLEGANAKKGRALLKESNLDIIAADSFGDAAEKAVQAAKEAAQANASANANRTHSP